MSWLTGAGLRLVWWSLVAFVGLISWSVRWSWSSGIVFRGCDGLRGPLGGNSKAVVFCSCLAAIFVVCEAVGPYKFILEWAF